MTRLRRGARFGEQRLHDEAGTEDEAVELIGVGVEIGDRPAGDAALHRRARDRRRDAQHQPRIERAWNERCLAEERRLAAIGLRRDLGGRLARQRRDRRDRRLLHRFVDLARADIESAAEDVGEAEDVVDLVRIVGAAGADHRVRPRLEREFRHDFRVRIGERHHQRVARHLLEHLGLQHAAGRKAEENVGAGNGVSERARAGVASVDLLPAVHQRVATLVDDPLDVADDDVVSARAERDEKIERSERRCAGAGADDLDLADLLARQLKRVDDRRGNNDRRAVLIVVEDGNAHAGLRLLLDLETFGTLDVLEIDSAEGRLERDDDVDQLVDVQFRHLDVEDVDAGEFLEQNRLAFHHRLRRQRADGAEPEHRGAVGEDRDQILARGVDRRAVRIGRDRLARKGDAGRIGERQIALIGERLRRPDLELARSRRAVKQQGVGLEIGLAFQGHQRLPSFSRLDCCRIRADQNKCAQRVGVGASSTALGPTPPFRL